MKGRLPCITTVTALFVLSLSISVNAGELENRLVICAMMGDVASVNTLILKGADVNAQDGTGGETALMAVANGFGEIGDAEVAQLLIDKGAKTEIKNKNGYTALIMAADKGNEGVASVLLNSGAHIEARDAHGMTPLMHAALSGKKGVAGLLIDRGADVNAVAGGFMRWTPLILAADSGKADIVRLLIEKGAKIEARDQYGYTALMRAADEGRADAVRALVDKGADINAKDPNGQTALDMAKAGVVVVILKKAGAKE